MFFFIFFFFFSSVKPQTLWIKLPRGQTVSIELWWPPWHAPVCFQRKTGQASDRRGWSALASTGAALLTISTDIVCSSFGCKTAHSKPFLLLLLFFNMSWLWTDPPLDNKRRQQRAHPQHSAWVHRASNPCTPFYSWSSGTYSSKEMSLHAWFPPHLILPTPCLTHSPSLTFRSTSRSSTYPPTAVFSACK